MAAEHHPCHELHRANPSAVAPQCRTPIKGLFEALESQKQARVWGIDITALFSSALVPCPNPLPPPPSAPSVSIPLPSHRGRTARDVAEAAAQPPISSRMTDPDWGHWTSKGCWLPRSERSVEADRWGPTARERRPPADERPDR